MRNALSVDVEDWFQVGAFEKTIARSDWDSLDHRVDRNTDAVLALLDDAGVKATFFTLGWVAERYPALIRRIVDGGHEIASHGYDHQRVFNFSPVRFRADLRMARDLIENASGCRVTGYRAPSFSIDTRTPWAHPILAEEGYAYSSSVAPVAHDHYGWPDSPRFAWAPVAGSAMIELPVTTAKLAGRTLAAGGGGFFRLLPYAFSRWAIRQVNHNEQRPAIIYFHPWEVDPDQPYVADAPLRSRVRHYINLRTMVDKLRRLTKEFQWCRVDELVASQSAQVVPARELEEA
jgi:polysaccharide deacetylase family protein (PEP-CTERM system associated)